MNLFRETWRGGRGINLTPDFEKAAQVAEEPVVLTAQLDSDGTYTLTIDAKGETVTIADVDPTELGDECARLVTLVFSAIRKGVFAKAREVPIDVGMNTPRPGREYLLLR